MRLGSGRRRTLSDDHPVTDQGEAGSELDARVEAFHADQQQLPV
jgi:hypothetical protein